MATIDSDPEQDEAAARRVSERSAIRDEKIQILSEPGGIARADDPARIAKRLDRLARYHTNDEMPRSPGEIPDREPEALMRAAARRVAESPYAAVAAETGDRPDVVLERIINNSDFLEIRYLDAGSRAARAVGLIGIRDERRRKIGFGTGSLVSDRLLLTNHHVLPDAATAKQSVIEFNFQDDADGIPLHPRQFGFDPDTFFFADKDRDFALVAVAATPEELAEFGFNPLIGAEGKAIVGEFVTIVQHPAGKKKQLVLRQQQVVDVPENFLHYIADTEPGSSGSPVFNDQWEIIALHHASVRVPRSSGVPGGYVNEGVRVSRILRSLSARPATIGGEDLVAALDVRTASGVVAAQAAPQPPMVEATPPAPVPVSDPPPRADDDGWVGFSVPLEIRVRLGPPAPAATAAVAPATSGASQTPPISRPPDLEAVVIDPDFAARDGFDTAFLGVGHEVALPQLAAVLQPLASVDTTSPREPRHVLRYHHYSVVMNKERGLAFWVGVNIDGALHTWRKDLARTKDRWFFDPRIPRSEQIGEDLYTKNALDRGHLVRRLDPAWGPDLETAKKANDDTFHFTNCTPQHEDFNQNRKTWAGLEDYILENAGKGRFRASVFTGPVFAPDDDLYRGVQLPRQFWKVAAMVKDDGTLSATGYLLSQESLIEGLESTAPFSYGAYKTFQVPIRQVEDLTGLSWGALTESDPLEKIEATAAPREITSPASLIL